MERYGLDPVPLAEPRMIHVRDVVLAVEQYSWGRIFFAEDRSHHTAMTWIEREEDMPVLPGWVHDARSRVDRPLCLGHHESDHYCDGGAHPITGERERACRWRRSCLYVQGVGKTEAGIKKALKQHSDEELWSVVELPQSVRHKLSPRPSFILSSAALVQEAIGVLMELGGWSLAENQYRSRVGEFFIKQAEGAEWTTLYRRRLVGTNPHHDATTMQSIANFHPHQIKVSARVEVRTANSALAREILGNAGVTFRMTADKMRTCCSLTLGSENLPVVADFISRVIQTNSLDSYGKGAHDRPKNPFR